eukprot:TRINITY_DN37392_c0_g1_i1.p1 TRINITY_DN37392_c0_g1~~TRINITY_DN37392_c0_g1_i1.p1  ORF type:complete len:1190 (+),score=184.44 TRINITY_DN37392_c0_g1_i1:64-3633(+)
MASPADLSGAPRPVALGEHVAERDANVIELVYEDLDYRKVEPQAANAEAEIRASLSLAGARKGLLSTLRVELAEGLVVRLQGTAANLAGLRGLPLASVMLLGQEPSAVKVSSNVRRYNANAVLANPPASSDVVSLEYTRGQAIEVFSNSYEVWGAGVVVRVKDDVVTAEFQLPDGGLARKDLPSTHSDLRPAARAHKVSWENGGRHTRGGEELSTSGVVPASSQATPSPGPRSASVAKRGRGRMPSRKRREAAQRARCELEEKAADLFGSFEEPFAANRPQTNGGDDEGQLMPGQIAWYPSTSPVSGSFSRQGLWWPCKVVPAEGRGRIALLTLWGQLLDISVNGVDELPIVPRKGQMVSDLGSLRYIAPHGIVDSASLESAIRTRFCSGEPYSRIGSTTIFTNPFRTLPSHGSAVLGKYAELDLSLPPHIFGTLASAYSHAVESSSDQAVVLFGDLGSGKSQLFSHALEFLTHVAAADEVLNSSIMRLPELLSPFFSTTYFTEDLADCWGSTRAFFAVKLRIDREGFICGARANVSCLHVDSLNFDAFALAARYPSARKWLGDERDAKQSLTDRTFRDELDFNSWRETVIAFGLEPDDLVRTLCALMLFGEIAYMPNAETGGLQCGPPEVVASASWALGVDRERLEDALCRPEASVIGRIGGLSTQKAEEALRETVDECYQRLVALVLNAANAKLVTLDSDTATRDTNNDESSSEDDVADSVGARGASSRGDRHICVAEVPAGSERLAEAVQVGLLDAAAGRGGFNARSDRDDMCDDDAQHQPRWTTRAVLRVLGWSSCSLIAGLAQLSLRPLSSEKEAADYVSRLLSGTNGRSWPLCCLSPNEDGFPLLADREALLRQIRHWRLADTAHLAANRGIVAVWPLDAFCSHHAALIYERRRASRAQSWTSVDARKMIAAAVKLVEPTREFNSPQKDDGPTDGDEVSSPAPSLGAPTVSAASQEADGCDEIAFPGVVSSESVYLNEELERLLADALDLFEQQLLAAPEEHPSKAGGDRESKRVSFYQEAEDEDLPLPTSTVAVWPPPSPRLASSPRRRDSLGDLGEGEQRKELVRRLRELDAEQHRLKEQGRRGIAEEVQRLRAADYGAAVARKLLPLQLVMNEMSDVYRIALEDREVILQDHAESKARVEDLKRESDHWRGEADRLWGQSNELRALLTERSTSPRTLVSA